MFIITSWGSHKRDDYFKEIQNILDSPKLKMQDIHEVRWFAFYDALQSIYQCWEAFTQTFNAASDAK